MQKRILAAGSIIGLGVVALVSQPILARQMDDWQLLPRPERVSELYFTDYRPLSASATPGAAQTVTFTVHNLEHRTTAYRYTLSVVSEEDMIGHPLGNGSFTLAHDRSLTTTKAITLPSRDGRVGVKVTVEYRGIAPGDSMPSAQMQSIHYWTVPRDTPSGVQERL